MSILRVNQTDRTQIQQGVLSLNQEEASLIHIVRRALSGLGFPLTIIEIVNSYTINAYTFEFREILSPEVLSQAPSTLGLLFSPIASETEDESFGEVQSDTDYDNVVETPGATPNTEVGLVGDEQSDSENENVGGTLPHTVSHDDSDDETDQALLRQTRLDLREARRLGVTLDYLRRFEYG